MASLGHFSMHSPHNIQFELSIVLLLTMWLTFKPMGHDLSHNLQFEQLFLSDIKCREGILIILPNLAPIVKKTPCGHRYLQNDLLPKIIDKRPIAIMKAGIKMTNCGLPFKANRSTPLKPPIFEMKYETIKKKNTKTRYLILSAFACFGFLFRTCLPNSSCNAPYGHV